MMSYAGADIVVTPGKDYDDHAFLDSKTLDPIIMKHA